MGKAAMIISANTGIPRKQAERIEYQLVQAGLLVAEPVAEETTVVDKQEVKKRVKKEDKGGET